MCVPPLLQYLPRADVVLVMLGGRITHSGTFQQLVQQGVDLSAFVPAAAHDGADGDSAGGSSTQKQYNFNPAGTAAAAATAAAAGSTSASNLRGLLSAGSQQLGSRADVALPVSLPQQQQQQPPSGVRQGSSMELVQLPPDCSKSLLLSGGSFGSHKPFKGLLPADGGSSRMQEGPAGADEAGAPQQSWLQEAGTAAAAATASEETAGGGSLAPLDGEFVSLQLDSMSMQPPAAAAAAAAAAAVSTTPADSAAQDSSEAAPLIPGGAADSSHARPAGSDGSQREHDSSNGGKANGSGGSKKGSPGQLVAAEARAKGQVRRSIYMAYLTAMGPFLIVPLAVLIGER
jgi:hypothetical protein